MLLHASIIMIVWLIIEEVYITRTLKLVFFIRSHLGTFKDDAGRVF